MATGFWQLSLKGERPLGALESDVGKCGGTLLRVDSRDGSTEVYFSADESDTGRIPDVFGGVKPTQVQLAEITRDL